MGQTIRFDQVVSARGQDFKLLGQPFISPDYVSVKATVIEHLKGEKLTIFKHRRYGWMSALLFLLLLNIIFFFLGP